MSNVISFPGSDNLPSTTEGPTVESCIEHAKEIELEKVIIIGTTKENKFYLSSSEDPVDINYLVDMAKRYLF